MKKQTIEEKKLCKKNKQIIKHNIRINVNQSNVHVYVCAHGGGVEI